MCILFTCRNDEVIAAASLNYDPAVSAVAERFAAGKIITKKEAEYVKPSCFCATFSPSFFLFFDNSGNLCF